MRLGLPRVGERLRASRLQSMGPSGKWVAVLHLLRLRRLSRTKRSRIERKPLKELVAASGLEPLTYGL